jgi:hypothetical protein
MLRHIAFPKDPAASFFFAREWLADQVLEALQPGAQATAAGGYLLWCIE